MTPSATIRFTTVSRHGSGYPSAALLMPQTSRGTKTSKPTPIDTFLSALSPDQRAALERIRATVHSIVPDATECISYGIPAFRYNGRVIFWFNATPNHCAIYAVPREIADTLVGYDTSGKGTIRFSPSKRIPATLIRRMMQPRLDKAKSPGGGRERTTAKRSSAKKTSSKRAIATRRSR